MKHLRTALLGTAACALAAATALTPAVAANELATEIAIGQAVNPVTLNIGTRDPNMVYLGSYIVNAVAGCNDCHTNPSYATGGNPFLGQPKQVNTACYLAGGQSFGPFISRNLTPEGTNGYPAGLTLAKFKTVMRKGIDMDHPRQLLQIMPWPTYQSMSDKELTAIYDYLSSIPSIAAPC